MRAHNSTHFILRNACQIAAIVAIILLLLISQLLRSSDIERNVGVQNLETPWHALLTIQALSESSPGVHKYLPIVTLGQARDKGVPWGASNPDAHGNYYYTSATSPTFVLPYAWFRLFGLDTTIASLAGFNFGLQIVSVLMLYGLLYTLLRTVEVTAGTAAFSSVVATAVSIFSREALLAFGMVYWFHGIYQFLLIAALYFILLALTKPGFIRPWTLALFSMICFLGAWVEWTGFAFNVGAAFVLLVFRHSKDAMITAASVSGSAVFAAAVMALHRTKVTMLGGATLVACSLLAGVVLAFRSARERALLAASMLMATAAATIVIVAHYASILDLPTLTWRLRARFEARSPLAHGGIVDNLLLLAQGYALSYGLFLLVVIGCGLLLWRTQMEPRTRQLIWLVVVLSAVPLAENVIVMENSAEFSYARLKFAVLAAVVTAVAIAFSSQWGRITITAGVVAASIFGFWSYKEDLTYYARWQVIDANNVAFRDKVVAEDGFDCSVLVTNVITRGYPTLLFHRMIFETWAFSGPTDKEGYLRQAIARTGACKGIFLEGKAPNTSPPFTNLPEYVTALVIDKNGGTKLIAANAGPALPERQSLFVKLFSHQGRDILARWRRSD